LVCISVICLGDILPFNVCEQWGEHPILEFSGYVWVAGYWAYRRTGYVWVHGGWWRINPIAVTLFEQISG